MKKVGHFFAMLWSKVWPVVKKAEPIAAQVVSVVDPKIAPAIIAGQAAVGAIEKEIHH
jgi:hypothetical protein